MIEKFLIKYLYKPEFKVGDKVNVTSPKMNDVEIQGITLYKFKLEYEFLMKDAHTTSFFIPDGLTYIPNVFSVKAKYVYPTKRGKRNKRLEELGI